MKRSLFCVALLVAMIVTAAPAAAQTVAQQMETMLDTINAELAAAGMNFRAVMVEYLTSDCLGETDTVVSDLVGNQRAEFDFVPFDGRREAWSGPVNLPFDDITYAIDTTSDAEPSGLLQSQTDAAIERAMMTWDEVGCSVLPLERNPDSGDDIRFADSVEGDAQPPNDPPGANFNIYADIQHAGWGDIEFAGTTVSATFTFGFCDPCSPEEVFTDLDNNGRLDTAFREIYYDEREGTAGLPRVWSVAGGDTDVESVALHEAGHGLSQEHFGQEFVDNQGVCQVIPRAVMNPVYDGVLRALQGTDVGGHCGNWANWPVN